jgi:hypothetical protein
VLSVDSVASFLLDRALIDVSWIIDGALTIRSVARRNRNLRVEGPGGAGFFIKQPDDPAHCAHETLRSEAAFHQFCRAEPGLAEVTQFVPRLIQCDIEQAILVFELIPDAISLWAEQEKLSLNGPSLEVVRSLGEMLGTIHRILRLTSRDQDPRLAWLSRGLPWVMTLHQPSAAILAGLSPATRETLRILQTQEVFRAGLGPMSREWRPESVIHGDVRFENVLVRRSPAGQEGDDVELWIADWELARIGDPAWDLAGALQDCLACWVSSMPLSIELSADEMIARAGVPLTALRGATCALWRGYRVGAGLDPPDARELLRRAVAFSAVRLIQSAFEAADGADRLPRRSVLMLQISENLLAEPERGQVQLYGIPPGLAAT